MADKRVLIIGGGGREHALAQSLKKSEHVGQIYAIPGNPGIGQLATCVAAPGGIEDLAQWAQGHQIGLTVVGPEAQLSVGIADVFAQRGLHLFGPGKKAAGLETSKVFAKEFMKRHNIPTAHYEIFNAYAPAIDYIKYRKYPLVIKADGLAAGKGVTVADNFAQGQQALMSIMEDRIFGEAGNSVIIEDFLPGEEASLLVFTDGEKILPMPAAQDHKRAFDGDQGPNTGGMGAYCPTRLITDEIAAQVTKEIIKPTIEGMAQEGNPYRGVLYVGLMITPQGPQVVEYNCRFGDPETQAILPLLSSDLYPILHGCAIGDLAHLQLTWESGFAICVILASGGYPGDYEVGLPILGTDEAQQMDDVSIFHAGTQRKNDQLVTSGGRVLGVTALGANLADAQKLAYEACEKITFPQKQLRRDIGWRGLPTKSPLPGN